MITNRPKSKVKKKEVKMATFSYGLEELHIYWARHAGDLHTIVYPAIHRTWLPQPWHYDLRFFDVL